MADGAGDRFARRVIRRVAMACTFAGAAVTMYARAIAPAEPGDSRLEQAVYTAAAFGLVAGLFLPMGAWLARRRLRAMLAWLEENRRPTPQERDAVISAPRQAALLLLWLWAPLAVVAAVLHLAGSTARDGSAVVLAAVVLAGFTTAALAYVIAERELRPAVRQVLAQSPLGEPASVGLAERFALVWGLGSGIPLLAVAVTPFVHDDTAHYDLWVPIVFLASVGAAMGWWLSRSLTRSVAVPLRLTRDALRRVECGELNVAIDVEDAGEVGLLQHGFNRMVEGLREREQIRDLFGQHVGADVARRALERGAVLGGEVHDVSVLFVDVIGSTELALDRGPEEVIRLLNQLFSVVVESAAAEGGWVNKFEGDGALCVFGAPEPLGDHAARVLRAAISLRGALLRQDLPTALGVSSGAVVAGNVGSADRLEYTVIGHAVNEAARLCDAAKHGRSRTFASAATVALAGDAATAWVAAGEVRLRGIPEPVAVFEPT